MVWLVIILAALLLADVLAGSFMVSRMWGLAAAYVAQSKAISDFANAPRLIPTHLCDSEGELIGIEIPGIRSARLGDVWVVALDDMITFVEAAEETGFSAHDMKRHLCRAYGELLAPKVEYASREKPPEHG